jgi:hypothetical protein
MLLATPGFAVIDWVERQFHPKRSSPPACSPVFFLTVHAHFALDVSLSAPQEPHLHGL